MMRRRILLWMGLGVLFVSLVFSGVVLAKETYLVQPGDTLSKIAAKTGVSQNALKTANHLKGNRLKANQTLLIPHPGKQEIAKSSPRPKREFYSVKKGDTLVAISRKTGVAVADLREWNRIRGNALKIGQRIVVVKKTKETSTETSPEFGDDGVDPELLAAEEDDAADFPLPEEALGDLGKDRHEDTGFLGKWNNPDEPKLLVKVAMGFLGAPYRLGGSAVTGIDCSGFVRKIYKFFDIDLPRTASEQSHVGKCVSRNELAEGDLLFFNTRKRVGHVGIYIGNNQFVHAASRNKGVRVDDLNAPYYDRRFIRAVRLKETEGGA